MSTTYTALAGLGIPAYRDRNWHLPLIASVNRLDGMGGIGPLCVQLAEVPSASLHVVIAPGFYETRAGTLGTYAGATFTAPASQVTHLWLTDAGVLTSGTSWPTPAVGTNIVRLATVTTNSTTVTGLDDERVAWASSGGLQTAATFLGGPATGSPAAATFRSLVPADYPVFMPSGAGHTPGAVPDPGGSAGTTRALFEDATWKVPSFAVFGPSGSGHSTGAVPDPGSSAGTTRALFEDGTWDVPGVPSGYVGQVSITTLGTITTGAWAGTTIAIAHGGTGATTTIAARAALAVPTKYSGLIGDGSTLAWAIPQATHLCASDRSNIAEVSDATSGAKVGCDITYGSSGGVTFTFTGTPPTTNQFRVTIIG